MRELSWKEKRNLYEAVRMSPEEKEEWERGLGVRITPEAKHRIEGFNDAVSFIEGRPDIPDGEIKRGSGIYHQNIINKKIKEQNERIARRAVCVKCGQWLDRKDGQESNGLMYCGYCASVCLGPRDSRWLPGNKE